MQFKECNHLFYGYFLTEYKLYNRVGYITHKYTVLSGMGRDKNICDF